MDKLGLEVANKWLLMARDREKCGNGQNKNAGKVKTEVLYQRKEDNETGPINRTPSNPPAQAAGSAPSAPISPIPQPSKLYPTIELKSEPPPQYSASTTPLQTRNGTGSTFWNWSRNTAGGIGQVLGPIPKANQMPENLEGDLFPMIEVANHQIGQDDGDGG